MRAKSSGQSPLLLLDVIAILEKEKIPYAVIGALAVSYYGLVRGSLDADALISLPDQGAALQRLKKALGVAGLKAIYRRADSDDPLRGMILVEDAFENQVDLLLGIKGLDPAAYARLRQAKFQGKAINMIGAEDLCAMKLFAGSAQDIDDVKGILKVSAESIDDKLLQTLTAGYGRRAKRTLEILLK